MKQYITELFPLFLSESILEILLSSVLYSFENDPNNPQDSNNGKQDIEITQMEHYLMVLIKKSATKALSREEITKAGCFRKIDEDLLT